MTGITIIGPRRGETPDDHFIRVVHAAAFGNEEEKANADMELIVKAMHQLGRDDLEQPYDSNDSRLDTSVYNKPISVHRDIGLNRYSNLPSRFPNSFCVMDRFGAFGKYNGTDTGIMIDCSIKGIGLTQTLAFSFDSSEDLVSKVAAEIFDLKNSSGLNAYTERSHGKGAVKLIPNFIEYDPHKLNFCFGQLEFGGKGITHGEVVTDLMKIIEEHPCFNPDRFLLSHYRFRTNIGSNPSEDDIRAYYRDLQPRITSVYREKASKAA